VLKMDVACCPFKTKHDKNKRFADILHFHPHYKKGKESQQYMCVIERESSK
jgi:hypothetical protein